MDTIDSKNEILNSWKQVAEYLGRGTRTVQRWEHDLALPVRRPRGKRRSAVIALRGDLDAWVRNRPRTSPQPSGQAIDNFSTREDYYPMPPENVPLQETIRTSRDLRIQSRQLRAEMSRALHSLVSSLERIRTTAVDVSSRNHAPVEAA